jgi:formate dehydrogenase subunit gamma
MKEESHLLPGGRILRYEFHERAVHWTVGLSYVYLLLTGLAFWSPWLFWIAVVLGGGTVIRDLHPWVGLIFSAGIVLMYRQWASQMHLTDADRTWAKALPLYIRNEDDKMPPADKFNGGQKQLFWGFLWCAIALLVSGVILWFTEYIPWNLRYLRYFAILVHPIAALLTIGLFMIHLYMALFLEGGANRSMLHGDVSMSWAQVFHRLWYDRVMGSSAARK